MPEYFLWFDLLGIAVFAISGTLAAWRNHMDGFGVIVLASVTAIGGGTLRDLILDVPVIWINNNTYFYAIFVAAIGTILLVRNRLTIPNNTLQIADAFGLAFFVIMGTQKALDHGTSSMVAIMLGTMSGVCGGMIRDVPVIWINNNTYFYAIFVAAIGTILLVRNRLTIPNNTLQIADAFGLAFFVIMGTQKALDHGTSSMVAIMLGTMSGVCGGMIRDVLCREVPMVFRGELYAVTCIFGGIIYTSLLALAVPQLYAMLAGMLGLLLLRLAAIRWHITIPVFGKHHQELNEP